MKCLTCNKGSLNAGVLVFIVVVVPSCPPVFDVNRVGLAEDLSESSLEPTAQWPILTHLGESGTVAFFSFLLNHSSKNQPPEKCKKFIFEALRNA